DLVGARCPAVARLELGAELALADAQPGELLRDRGGERRRRLRPCVAQGRVQAVDLRLGRRERSGRSRRGIVAALDRLELRTGRGRALEQLGEGVGAVAAPEVGEELELGFDVLEPPGLRLEAV